MADDGREPGIRTMKALGGAAMRGRPVRPWTLATINGVAFLSCSYGGVGFLTPPGTPPPFTSVPLVRVSEPSNLAAGCNGAPQTGTRFVDTEVGAYATMDPANPTHFVGAWQQDRWSNGGAQGVMLAASFNGGRTWSLSSAPFSHCTGGDAGNGGDFERVSNPWVAASTNSNAYAITLAFSGGTFASGSTNAVLVARSMDGGVNWGDPVALIQDGDRFFNDRPSITADPVDTRFVYATWTRLAATQGGPAWFARSVDGGASWDAARTIFDPGPSTRTAGSQIAVLPGAIVSVFTEVGAGTVQQTAAIRAMRSTDRGDSWSVPVTIAVYTTRGTISPDDGTLIRDGSPSASVAVDGSGALYVVWQDARFSGGQHDGIALSRSLDGGLSWTAPVRVNANTAFAAFTPTVHVRADGVIGVTYYDFRSDTDNLDTLLTDYWLATSTDATNWSESHLTGPFDLARAPDSGGLFLGDYQALTSLGSDFLPFFVQTNAGTGGNRTDVFMGFSAP
jgi:hypothetical protein